TARCVIPFGTESDEHRAHQLLEVAPRDLREGVAEGDHLALLGQTDPSIVSDPGHGEDRLVGAPAPASDGATATAEQTEIDIVLATYLAQTALRLVKGPVGHPVAAILVAVRITEHDLLETTPRREQRSIGLVLVELLHEIVRGLEILDRFEQRHEIETGEATVRTPQSDLLGEEHRLHEIADRVRHADDVTADGVGLGA